MGSKHITVHQRRWLQNELAEWQTEGLVSPEQSERILIRYESPAEASDRQRSQSVFVLSALAILLVGLGVLLLIGYNWQAIPRPAKLGIIFTVLAGTHVAGFYLRYHRRALVASELVFFLGCLLYGCGIWLVAQAFHLESHYPDGVWWWAVGVLPFALCLDTLLGHVLFVSLMALWAGMEVIGFPHLSPWFFGHWGLANGAYTLPLLALPGLIWAYRKNSPWAVGLYAPLLAWWVVLQPIAWHQLENVVFFVGAVGPLFLIIAESHRRGSPFALPYRVWGVLLTLGVLVPLSYFDFNRALYDSGAKPWSGLVGVFIILGLVAVALAVVESIRARAPGAREERSLLRRQWLPVSLAVLMALLSLWGWVFAGEHGARLLPEDFDKGARVAAALPTVLANVGIVVFAIWLMRLGIREERGRPFAAGVGCFLLWAILRYFDLFSGVGGMVGAALLFFLCGAAMFGLAMYWRGRKEVQHG